MKLIGTLVLILNFSASFSQWTRVNQLPSIDIASLYHKDNTLYAGGKSIIYVSKDKGLTWDSTNTIPQLFLVTSIIVYKNELYAAAPNSGVFKSPDGGTTWQNISTGIFPDVSDFCEFRGDLYAATFGNSAYKLNPANRNSWLFFSNGLSNFSANLPSIAANSNAIVAGTLGNGIYGQLPANSTTWEERLLTGQLDPNEGAYDIVTGHDTLFYAGRTGKFYMSTDNGLTWNFIGDRLTSFATTMVNAKEAVIVSRRVLEAGVLNVRFYYIKKDSLQHPFVNFSVVPNHFTYKIDVLGDKLWDASNKGLFFMSLSDLPGITVADDSVALIPLPVRFISFYVTCEKNNTLITWKTAQEQNSNQFSIERSVDGNSWTVIGSIIAAGSMITENNYSFSDTDPLQNSLYRIAEHDSFERVQYSGILRPSCSAADAFSLWPNPVHDVLSLNLFTGTDSRVMIKIFDDKGALVKMHEATVLKGRNLISVDMKSLIRGMYLLSAEWNNGQMKRAVQVLKQ